MDSEEFLEEYVPTDCRDKARAALLKIKDTDEPKKANEDINFKDRLEKALGK